MELVKDDLDSELFEDDQTAFFSQMSELKSTFNQILNTEENLKQ